MNGLRALCLIASIWTLGLMHAATAAPVTFSGTAIDAGGKPAGGATVSIALYDPARTTRDWRRAPVVHRTTSGDDGGFRITVPITSEDWTAAVIVTKAGHGPGGREVASPATPTGLRISLTRPSFVAGRVVSRSGRPIVGATVKVEWADLLWAHPEALPLGAVLPPVSTDADGRFRIDPIPEEAAVNLVADHPGFASTFTNGLDLSGTGDVVLSMGPGGSIVGRVLDAEGKPAAGITVRCYEFLSVHAETKTDGSGSFRFDGLRGAAYTLRAEPSEAFPDRVTGAQGLLLKEGAEARCPDLRFVRAGIVSGKVTDEKGRPQAGIRIAVYRDFEYADRAVTTEVGPATDTAADGAYRLRVPPGKWRVRAEYFLFGTISRPGEGEDRIVQPEQTVAPDQTTHVDFEVPNQQLLRGRILDARGRPAAGATLDALVRPNEQDEGGVIASRTTDAEGRFAFRHRLSAKDGVQLTLFNHERTNGAQARFRSSAIAGEWIGRLQRLPLITGTVTDKKGVPIAGAIVGAMGVVHFAGGEMRSSLGGTRADARGRYSLAVFPDSTYQVSAGAKGYGFAEKFPVDVGSADRKVPPLRFTLNRADGAIAGVVVDEEGRPLAGASVVVETARERGGARVGETTSDARGQFRIEKLAPGELNISAGLAGHHGGERQPVRVGATNVRLVLPRFDPVIARAPTPEIGAAAPELRVTRWVNGAGPRGLGELRGRSVILFFSTPFNPAAKGWISALKALHARLKGAGRQDVAILAIYDAPAEDAAEEARAEGLPFPIGVAERMKGASEENSPFYVYGVRQLPSVFLLSPDGRVRAVDPEPEALIQTVMRN